MKNTVKILFLLFLSSLLFYTGNFAQERKLPFNIGNKWYYKGNYHYEDKSQVKDYKYYLIKEITDTLSDGSKEVTSRYIYKDSTETKKEYWIYNDGKFYNQRGSYYYVYNDNFTKDTCVINCYNLSNYQWFNISAVAQICSEFFISHAIGHRAKIITLPYIGIVSAVYYKYPTTKISIRDSIFLCGMYKDGVVIGDTVINIPIDTTRDTTKDTTVTITIPSVYKLSQNYPNPFNPITVISYQLPVSGNVTLKVYDALGKEVATLVNEEKPAGFYDVKFDGSSLSSGVYFYRLKAGNYVGTKKLILMK